MSLHNNTTFLPAMMSTGGSETARARALLHMMAQAGIGAEETERRLTLALDAGYWASLNPELSIAGGGNAASLQRDELDTALQRELAESFRRSGWFRTPALLTATAVSAMRSGVEKLQAQGWPEGFAFVYDEFWLASRIPFIRTLLQDLLGEGYQQLPNLWGHYVKPLSGGWSPHVDGAGKKRLTLWIPLTDVTVENSCMFVIPEDKTPEGIAAEFPRLESIARRDVARLLQNARPLPGPAGCVMSWHHQLIHWGAPSFDPVKPRISISQEFLAASAHPGVDELPLFDLHNGLPAFAQRLDVIGRAILSYQRLEPLLARYSDLASRISHPRG